MARGRQQGDPHGTDCVKTVMLPTEKEISIVILPTKEELQAAMETRILKRR